MSRTVSQIQASMIADIQSDPTLSGLTSTSKRAIWRLFTFIFATAIFLLESLIDIFKSSVEATAAVAAPASASWIQDQVLKFQYDALVPQIVQLINFAPAYPTVDVTKRIITRASVITTVAGQTLIKVAKNEPPVALTSDELSALQSYVNTIGATIFYTVTSTNADELYLNADIYYQGQYSAIIQENVINTLNAYLAALPFNGVLKVSDLERTILNTTGVNDVILKNVKARQDSDPFTSGTFLVQNQQLISRVWPTISGYIIPETTSGQTLTDSLNFIAQ